jgi:hypothetical protein
VRPPTDDGPRSPEGQTSEATNDQSTAKSQATALVELVLAHPGLELFHGPDHKPYAYVPIAQHFETWPIRSRAFRRWAAGMFYA